MAPKVSLTKKKSTLSLYSRLYIFIIQQSHIIVRSRNSSVFIGTHLIFMKTLCNCYYLGTGKSRLTNLPKDTQIGNGRGEI